MFFTNMNDINKQKQCLLEKPDVYMSQILYSGQGVISVSVNDITLTPAVSPAFTPDELISTVGLNLIVHDDDGNVFIGKVTDNAAVSITFLSTAMVKESDDSAGAATDWTAAGTVSFYVLEPSAVNKYGNYFGVTKNPSMTIEDEMAMLEDQSQGIIAEGLIRVNMDVTGENYNCTNPDVLQAVRNMSLIGAQTTQSQLAGGFRPNAAPLYRLTFIGKQQDGNDFFMQYFMGRLRQEGEFNPTGEEYANIGWGFRPLADPLRPKQTNAYKIMIDK